MNIKDLKLRLATEEANRLKQEVADCENFPPESATPLT